ncbi:hypothetical protein BG015_000515 [Linnemannia schmuckeri]|uniref:DNA-(apurinic or apyrimidinic site) endonuclease n=1 Tax=Linnemannia schmuckeri TaxID=64567 RepID=A0A9P5RQZ8_9FUNG|nr:hypothetical protein BG015_000515 [Linnemannia schmuckeri]
MVTKRTTASSTRSSSRLTAQTDTSNNNVSVKVSVTSSTTVATTTTTKLAKRATQDEKADDDVETASTEDKEDGDYTGGATKKQKKAATTATVAAALPALKKQKSATKVPIRANSHTNTAMPNPLVLPKTPDGCVKITSWNVSGLNSSLKKGFKTYITAEDADVICIQEHKVQQPLLNIIDPKVYPFSWWGFEEKKGYAGVAIFCKTKPINVTAGLPTHPDPACTKGRIVTLEYPTCFILGCYVPNAGQGLVRLKERMVWDKAMKAWLLDLKTKGKQIIWTGDLNVCHQPIDLRNPATNTTSAGFTPEERAGFSEILEEVDLVDTFREIQGTGKEAEGQYSYFSYRFQCRVKGIGWRLDYFVTDQKLYKERLVESVIREECYGASDHVPVVLVIKGDL